MVKKRFLGWYLDVGQKEFKTFKSLKGLELFLTASLAQF